MLVILNIPEVLAARLRPLEDKLQYILELGLREFNATPHAGFQGVAEVLELLASLPTPDEMIALRPSETLQAQISALLEKNRTEGLTPAEEQQWEQYQYVEHLVRMAKARAYLRRGVSSS